MVKKSVGDLEKLVTAAEDRWSELEGRMADVLANCELDALLVESGAIAAELIGSDGFRPTSSYHKRNQRR